MTWPSDIDDRLERDFGPRALAARRRLEEFEAAQRESAPRIIRCVIHLARGDLEQLDVNISSAKIDWRDVIYWAEYDRDDVCIHDFNEPFAGSAKID